MACPMFQITTEIGKKILKIGIITLLNEYSNLKLKYFFTPCLKMIQKENSLQEVSPMQAVMIQFKASVRLKIILKIISWSN